MAKIINWNGEVVFNSNGEQELVQFKVFSFNPFSRKWFLEISLTDDRIIKVDIGDCFYTYIVNWEKVANKIKTHIGHDNFTAEFVRE